MLCGSYIILKYCLTIQMDMKKRRALYVGPTYNTKIMGFESFGETKHN